MSIENVIKSIQNNKKIHKLDFSIKTKTEYFTDKLFHVLFDSKTLIKDHIDSLELEFREIYTLACYDDTKHCDDVWDAFLHKMPGLLENFFHTFTGRVKIDTSCRV